MAHYNMLVIGSGPAGQKAAIQAAKVGKKVGVIERQKVAGGICINTGTIPTKSLREAVLFLSGFRQRNLYGASYRVKKEITFEDLALRCDHVVKAEQEVIQNQLIRNHVDFIIGSAANRAAMIMVTLSANNATNIAASLGGLSGTLIPGTDSGTIATIRTLIFCVINPPSGSQTATVSWKTSVYADVGVITVSGDSQEHDRHGGRRDWLRVCFNLSHAWNSGGLSGAAAETARVRRQRDYRSAPVSDAQYRRNASIQRRSHRYR